MPPNKHAPFGTLLGIARGNVQVYSCDADTAPSSMFRSNDFDYNNYVDGVLTGIKWQCVELARRWLLVNFGVTFADVRMAYNIFDIPMFQRASDESSVKVSAFENGSKVRPVVGSVLIWRAKGFFRWTGHVAIVTGIHGNSSIDVVEQNVEDTVWPEGVNYSRKLKVKVARDGSFTIRCTYEDTSVLGWMNVDLQTKAGGSTTEGSRSERALYARVISHFQRRTRDIDWSRWTKLDARAQGYEGTVYVNTGKTRRRVLKVIVVSLPEDPIARFDMMETVNRRASRAGISPQMFDVYYTRIGEALAMCIEQEFFEGDAFCDLPAAEAKRVRPLVEAAVLRMIRCGIVHPDLHSGNVLVSLDRKTVRLIDFCHGALDTRAPDALLTSVHLRKLTCK